MLRLFFLRQIIVRSFIIIIYVIVGQTINQKYNSGTTNKSGKLMVKQKRRFHDLISFLEL